MCPPFSAFSVLESSRPMMRSESRTEDTSALVTTTAASAWRIGSGLSRISAWASLASPWTTFTRSNTTRRSAPITRSRLRSPTSKSTTTTFAPPWARAAPRAAVDVVLPTPPLPDVTTTTCVIVSFPLCVAGSLECRQHHGRAVEPGLRGFAAQRGVHVLGGAIDAVDRQQFGFEAAAEDAGGLVAVEPGDGAPAQHAIDVDGSAGDDLCPPGDGAEYRHVAALMDDRLAG